MYIFVESCEEWILDVIMASGIGGSEEKFLETFFQLISQFAFDKAKDLSVSKFTVYYE